MLLWPHRPAGQLRSEHPHLAEPHVQRLDVEPQHQDGHEAQNLCKCKVPPGAQLPPPRRMGSTRRLSPPLRLGVPRPLEEPAPVELVRVVGLGAPLVVRHARGEVEVDALLEEVGLAVGARDRHVLHDAAHADRVISETHRLAVAADEGEFCIERGHVEGCCAFSLTLRYYCCSLGFFS